MIIRRYLVNHMQEAVGLIKRDLGPDAVIISSRRVRQPGWRGLFSPGQMEVTAALDERGEKPIAVQAARVEPANLTKEIGEVKALLKQLAVNHFVAGERQELASWRQLLTQMEVNGETIQELLQGIADNTGLPPDQHQARQRLEEHMAKMLVVPQQKGLKVFAFVGSTGVGKTTTLAKVAAQSALFQEKRVALITIDTYRIGAVDQLKIYAEILGLPLAVVMTPQELKGAVERFHGYDAVLIDTAGRPSKNKMGIAELKGFLDTIAPLEVFLVLSCTTKPKDQYRIIEDFKCLNYTQLIFTKTDETDSLGSILNIARETRLPIAFITNGQSVPDDIRSGDPNELAKLIIRQVG
ncbi:MAG: flagellar biosynthesis protein FlhF [Syntrophomonadaceae bacterium]|nr:flagellar biosynthesis protein FlhF [Syntrophomonadaceae bacterium]